MMPGARRNPSSGGGLLSIDVLARTPRQSAKAATRQRPKAARRSAGNI